MFEIFTLIIASPAFLLATSQNSVLAANTVYGLPEIIRVGVSLVVLVAWFLAAAFIVWGAVLMILSGGKEDKMKSAVNMIRYAVIGLFLIIVLLFVLPKAWDVLGFPISQYINPRMVFDTMQDISGKILSDSPSSYSTSPSSLDNLSNDYSTSLE